MKRKKAIFSQWHNETVFGPLWLKYYSKFFDPSDIYIIHLEKPRSVPFDSWLADQTGFVRIPTPDKQICDYQLVVDRVKALQRKLLADYECVIFAEADEFVVHVAGLDKYIADWVANRKVEVCLGLEVVHQLDGPKTEPPIDLSQPILAQRRWWRYSHFYDKPLLSRIPLDWSFGFHFCHQVPWQTTDPNLLLLHLHKMDYDVCVRRNVERMINDDNSELVKSHPAGSPGWQHYVTEFGMKHWFGISMDTGQPIEDTEIPEYVRRLPL